MFPFVGAPYIQKVPYFDGAPPPCIDLDKKNNFLINSISNISNTCTSLQFKKKSSTFSQDNII